MHETEGQLILNGSYDIGFTMDLTLKDIGFALGFGREFGVPLKLAGLTEQIFIEGKAAYGGSAQSTSIVQAARGCAEDRSARAGIPGEAGVGRDAIRIGCRGDRRSPGHPQRPCLGKRRATAGRPYTKCAVLT